jgi:hypothetical protein
MSFSTTITSRSEKDLPPVIKATAIHPNSFGSEEEEKI